MEKKMKAGVHLLETGAAAFGSGMLMGRYGTMEVFGVPVTALAAIGLHAVGFLGLAGQMTDDAHAFGNGFLANYLVTLGAGVGGKLASEKQKPAMSTTSASSFTDKNKTKVGALPSAQVPLTQAELQAMASAVT